MTKEIIIDGVNVSECAYYKGRGKCRIPHFAYHIRYTGCDCVNWNCDFKQLKRAEQKLEKIKDIIYDKESCYKPGKCSKCLKKCQYQIVDKILQIIERKENDY